VIGDALRLGVNAGLSHSESPKVVPKAVSRSCVNINSRQAWLPCGGIYGIESVNRCFVAAVYGKRSSLRDNARIVALWKDRERLRIVERYALPIEPLRRESAPTFFRQPTVDPATGAWNDDYVEARQCIERERVKNPNDRRFAARHGFKCKIQR